MIHYMNNKPICIYNIYKYFVNLYKLGVIPEFKVEVKNNLTEVIFTFNYDNKRTSTIIYDTNTDSWISYTNVLSLKEIYSNPNFAYLFEKQMVGYDNDMTILRSYDINDIIEPSLTPFSDSLRNLTDVNNDKLHNINHRHYYMFINNLIKNDRNNIFNKYADAFENIPKEVWENVYQYYKPNDINYNDFIEEFL